MPIHTDMKEPHLEGLWLNSIVGYAIENGASDIRLKVSMPFAIRIEGVLRLKFALQAIDMLSRVSRV